MNALQITGNELGKALSSATFGTVPAAKAVEDDNGNRVGWIREWASGRVDWGAGSDLGFARDRQDALEQIETAVLRQREIEAREAAEKARIAAMPQPVRDAYQRMLSAETKLTIEQMRFPPRQDDLGRARDWFMEAEAEYRQALEAQRVAS